MSGTNKVIVSAISKGKVSDSALVKALENANEVAASKEGEKKSGK